MTNEATPTEYKGRKIRALRIMAGLKQSELAELARVSRMTIVAAERGKRLHPATSEAIARALGIPAESVDP